MKDIGIIGFGNMGSAVAERIKSKHAVWVFEKDINKLKGISGINVADNIIDLVGKVDAVILAVKPQDLDSVLSEIKNYSGRKLIISIAAGISTKYIEKRLGRIRIIRVMPNMPARIGKGMTCLCKGEFASGEDLSFAESIFQELGKILLLKENMMDAATAISGSGPGYLYDWAEGKAIEEIKEYANEIFIPALSASAQNIGFTAKQAKILAETTGEGSIAYIEKTRIAPLELKKQIASNGGTTEAGMEVLHRGGSLEEAVKAALKRAEELSKKE